MKKSSVGGRSSKAPIRLSNRGSIRGNVGLGLGLPPDGRTSSSRPRSSSETRPRTLIPVLKHRASSTDRDSRSRMRAVDLSSKKKPSISHAMPSTPALQHLDMPLGFSSTQSTRSRSGSRCGSAERGFKPQKAKIADTRPIKDPGFQHRAMVRVFNYFQRQPQAIRDLCPPPQIRSIMIQSFVDMMGHLLHHFFNNHGVYKKNYTEEIPKLMKQLYYPGAMSTSWLKTVNAPHAWPHVVAVMSWLVDLIVQRENMNIGDFFLPRIEGEDTPSSEQIIFTSLLNAFGAWDDNDTARAAQINSALEASLKEIQGFTDEDLERLTKEIAEMSEQLNDPEEREMAEKHRILVESVKTLTLKEKEITNNILTIEESTRKMKEKKKDYQKLCEKLEHTLESKTSMRDQLVHKIKTQSMSVEEAKAIKEEISYIEQEIKNNNHYLSKVEKMRCAGDMKIASIKQKLNDMCVEFNNEILQSNFTELHQFTVQTNLNFFERDLDKARSEMEKIDKGLEQLVSSLNEKIKAADCYLEKQIEILKELKTESKRVNDKLKELKEEQLNQEKELESLEAENERMERDFKSEYDAVKAKSAYLVKCTPDVNAITEEVAKSSAQIIEEEHKLEEMVKMGAEFLCEQVKIIDAYKKEVLKELTED